jgi:opacity protein-like surface antigen
MAVLGDCASVGMREVRMRRIRVLAGTLIVICATAVSAGAQTMTIIDNSSARASLRLGYGGHGPDWDASIDSPLFADLVRFRAGVGRDRWDSEFDSYPDPTVTRFAASAIIFIRSPSDLRPYVGLGLSRYVPRGGDWNAQTGKRLIAGMEGSGERWTVGVEVEIELPRDSGLDRPAVGNELLPTGRIGLAVRRRF